VIDYQKVNFKVEKYAAINAEKGTPLALAVVFPIAINIYVPLTHSNAFLRVRK